jgi:dTDP-glucose 4,6-dehydratase
MKLFVTGGAGFIGSNYVRHVLASSDDEVTVFDALTYAGNLSSLADVADNRRYSFVQGDICDRAAVAAAMAGHDMVVHFAAESHVDRSIVDPDTFVRTNCLGTNVMCDVARHVGVERFLHISTDEVYGSIEEGSFVETDRLGPRSPYSSSKAGSDLIALSYEETYGLPVIVSRSSNNFGPFQFPEKVIPLFVTNLLDGKKVPLYGDGLNVRDWIHVADNCAGVDTVLRNGIIGEVAATKRPIANSRRWCFRIWAWAKKWLSTSKIVSATTAATPSIVQRRMRSAGSRPAISMLQSPRPSSGTALTAPGGNR